MSVVQIDAIKRVTAAHFGVRVNHLESPRRNAMIVEARHTAMYLSQHLTTFSTPEIGREFGGKDHATVLYAIQKVEESIEANLAKWEMLETLMTRVSEYLASAHAITNDALGALIAARVTVKMAEKPEAWPTVEPRLTRLVLDYMVEFPKHQNEAVDQVLEAFKIYEGEKFSNGEKLALSDLERQLNNLKKVNEVRKK